MRVYIHVCYVCVCGCVYACMYSFVILYVGGWMCE